MLDILRSVQHNQDIYITLYSRIRPLAEEEVEGLVDD